jgi:hypothetical protein
MGVARRRRASLLFGSFKGWTKDHLGRDVLAGLTLAAITVPEQMATAKKSCRPLLGVSLFVGGDAAPYAERQLRPSPGHLLKSLPDLELLALQRPTAALQGVKCISIRWRHDTIETLTQLRELKLKSAT